MKLSTDKLRKLIKEELFYREFHKESEKLEEVYGDSSSYARANKIVEKMMTNLENKFYGKYPDEDVDEFAVEAMAIIGQVESLIVKLMDGGYRVR